MKADSLWPWRPLTLHSLASSEPPPSDRHGLPCGGPSRHADINKTEQSAKRFFQHCQVNLTFGKRCIKPLHSAFLHIESTYTHNVTDVWRCSVLEEQ